MIRETNPETQSGKSPIYVDELADKPQTDQTTESLLASSTLNSDTNSHHTESDSNSLSIRFVLIDVILTAVSFLKQGLSYVQKQIIQSDSTTADTKSPTGELNPETNFKPLMITNFQSKNINEKDNKSENPIFRLLTTVKLFLSTKVRLKERLLVLANNFMPDFSFTIEDHNQHFEEEDIADEFIDFFGPHRGGNKFLNKYSIADVNYYIRNSPILDILENQLGFTDWYIEFDLSDSFVHYAYLRSKSIIENDRYIGFLIIQNNKYHLKLPKSSTIIPNAINVTVSTETETDASQKKPKKSSIQFVKKWFPEDADMLNIRWFSLQNPRGQFSSSRPRLPGQKYPGTGLAKPCFSIITKLALKNHRDGIINVPENFHNAYLYEHFVFLNPDDQGVFERLKDDLINDINQRGIGAVSWAIYLGFLRDKDNTPKKFLPHEQIFPLSLRMFRYFKSQGFRNRVAVAKKNSGPFHILWEEAEKICCSHGF